VEAREGTVYHQWIEEGVSARTDDISKRPLFRRAIDEALAGRYDVLVVHKLDRFSRNVRITLEYLDKLEKAGVGFVSITEQMDFSTPIGRVILANLAAFGQYYSDNLSAEVSKGLKERAAQGLWVGPVPFGYAKGDDGCLEVVPGEAEAVQQVFSMYASGNKTYREIATWLNQSVHETRSRRRDADQRRYLWTRYSVSGILTNPFYLGQVRYKGQPLPRAITHRWYLRNSSTLSRRCGKCTGQRPRPLPGGTAPISSKGLSDVSAAAARSGHSTLKARTTTGRRTPAGAWTVPTAGRTSVPVCWTSRCAPS